MAGRTQPIVYKPTNVTKYADAYANRLNAAAAEAKKQQAIRDKRRQKMSDELDVSMAGTFVAPAAQDAWDAYREEKMKYLQENPNKIKRVISELTEYKKSLGGVDEEYIRKSSAIDPNTQHGVDYAMSEAAKGLPEGANHNNINQVRQAALYPFNMVTDKQNLEEGISAAQASVLEDIYNSDERDDFFVSGQTITNIGDGYQSTKFARNVIDDDTKKMEIARRIVGRLEDKYLVEASFLANNNNDFNLETEISQRNMGLAPFAGKAQKDDKDKSSFDFKYLGDNAWSNGLFSFVRGETKKGRTAKFQEEVSTDFISIEKEKSTGDVPIQEYFYEGQNIKGRVKGIEKVGDTIYAVVPTTIDAPKVINGKEYPNSKVKKRVDARVELDPTYNLSIFTNAYKISPSQLEYMLSNKRGGTQSGNVGYNNPNNKRFTQSPPPTPPSMGQ